MMKSPNWLSKILKEETVTSTNDRLAELCQEKEIKEFTTLMAEYQTAGKGQRGNSWDSQSIVGIGININQEEFHSSAPNPVSLRQITQKETDRMEVLNSVLEHIINLYSRIENRETDIITKIQEYYLKAQYRKEGYHPYCDAKGEFTAKLIRVEPDGHLILKDKNGSLRKYAFKEVKYIL